MAKHQHLRIDHLKLLEPKTDSEALDLPHLKVLKIYGRPDDPNDTQSFVDYVVSPLAVRSIQELELRCWRMKNGPSFMSFFNKVDLPELRTLIFNDKMSMMMMNADSVQPSALPLNRFPSLDTFKCTFAPLLVAHGEHIAKLRNFHIHCVWNTNTTPKDLDETLVAIFSQETLNLENLRITCDKVVDVPTDITYWNERLGKILPSNLLVVLS